MKTGDWLTCPRCEKPVRLKRWFGLLHICPTPTVSRLREQPTWTSKTTTRTKRPGSGRISPVERRKPSTGTSATPQTTGEHTA